MSAHINEAYKTLQDPLLRAQYLLSLRGFDVASDETAKVDDHKLLMEVLDAREEIEAADEEEQLLPLKKSNTARIDASLKVLEDAFGVDDMVTAREETMKLRYWFNIRDSLATWEKGKPVVLAH
jgi:molecular chaperone HscB